MSIIDQTEQQNEINRLEIENRKNQLNNADGKRLSKGNHQTVMKEKTMKKPQSYPSELSDEKYYRLIEETSVKYSDEVIYPQSVLKVNGDIWGTSGGISIIKGKAKSRKTFLLTAAVAAAVHGRQMLDSISGSLPENKSEVWYFDTEQASYNIVKIAQRIKSLISPNRVSCLDNLHIKKIRNLATDERLAFINKVIIERGDKIGLLIIDGLRDLIFDINSAEQSTLLVNLILKWTDEKDIHLAAVLHSNKTDDNLRGHIGTELLNKAETIINVEKSSTDSNISIVSCEVGRHVEFEEFAFYIDQQGLPRSISVPNVAKEKRGRKNIVFENYDDEFHKKILKRIFTRKNMHNTSNLKLQLKKELNLEDVEIGFNIAGNWINEYEINNWIKFTKRGMAKMYELVID